MLATRFSEEIEQRMRDLFQSLNERDRRRYARTVPGWSQQRSSTAKNWNTSER